MVNSGSLIMVAEMRLRPSSVVWRVGSGPSAAIAGIQRWRDSGVLSLLDWEDLTEGITCETYHGLHKILRSTRRMADQLLSARPIPLGEMPDMV